jgi:hypothetical protein
LFHSLIHLRMSASSSVTLRCAERRSLRLVSSANPPLHQVDPAGAGRREVQVEPGVAQQPLLDRRSLVGAVVVADQVQVQPAGDGGVDELEETQELLVAVPPLVLGDHRASGQVQGGEQAGGAVPHVVMRHPRHDPISLRSLGGR